MSAFVVQDHTINRVLAYFVHRPEYRGRVRALAAECGDGTPAALGAAMFALNVTAVNVRYGPGEAESFRPLDYAYRAEAPGGAVATYKSLRCWLYQCAEGLVPETPLYREMESLGHRLAGEIVARLPEYDSAPWD